MNKHVLKFVMVLFVYHLFGCNSRPMKISQKSDLTSVSDSIDLLRLNTIAYTKDTIVHSNTVPQTIGKSDTLRVGTLFQSVLRFKSIVKTQINEFQLCNIKINYRDKVIFESDSVLNTGDFQYNPINELLSFIIIRHGNDDMSYDSDLYVYDAKRNYLTVIGRDLGNCGASLIDNNSNIYYFSYNILYKYDYKKKVKRKVLTIMNDDANILRIHSIGTSLCIDYSSNSSDTFQIKTAVLNLHLPH